LVRTTKKSKILFFSRSLFFKLEIIKKGFLNLSENRRTKELRSEGGRKGQGDNVVLYSFQRRNCSCWSSWAVSCDDGW
jgi:hypothetical protein